MILFTDIALIKTSRYFFIFSARCHYFCLYYLIRINIYTFIHHIRWGPLQISSSLSLSTQ